MDRRARRSGCAFALLALVAASSRAAAQSYTITDLGVLTGGITCHAYALNESGQVVGSSTVTSGDEHAFFWSQGAMTDLGTLGGPQSAAYGVNNLAVVVGESLNAAGQPRAFRWSGTTPVDLGTLGGASAHASAINKFGTIVGWSYDAAGSKLATQWSTSGTQSLGTIAGGDSSFASDISDNGRVAMNSNYQAGGSFFHAAKYVGGVVTDLGTLGGNFSAAEAIDLNGQVGGQASYATAKKEATFWNSSNQVTKLGILGKAGGSALGFNSKNHFVGYAFYANSIQAAFIWDSTSGMRDLNSLIAPGSGWYLEEATDINEAGQIVGSGTIGGQTRGYLLNPVGCLTSLTVLGANIGGTLAYRHESPCHPNLTGVTFVSLAGGTINVVLPGGVVVKVNPDLFFFIILSNSSVSVAPLDANGVGTTGALPIPNQPFIVGLPIWAASGILDLSTAKFVDTSATVPFALR